MELCILLYSNAIETDEHGHTEPVDRRFVNIAYDETQAVTRTEIETAINQLDPEILQEFWVYDWNVLEDDDIF